MTKRLKQCVCTVLIALLLTLAAATIAEKGYGREWALAHVYGAWWFAALWALLAATAIAYIIRVALYRNKPALLLHLALAVILCGALITFLFADRGHLRLRQGQTLHTYISDHDATERPLPFAVRLVLFDIEYHPNTDEPADFISFLKIDGEIVRVSMNKIYRSKGFRLCQLTYDPDEMGSTLLVNHDPWGIGVTYAGYLLLALSMGWLWRRRVGWKTTLCILLPVAVLWFGLAQMNPTTPVLRSPLLAAHVSVVIAAYALLLGIALIAVAGLCLPARRCRLYHWNTNLLYPALFLLAAGIFIGALWANISWGRYWGWDAKETWALITLLLYAIPCHRQSIALFRSPYRFHLYCACAFAAVAMTFFGVTYLLGGIHSYVQ
ncbi:MAG: cytochrome c biogenesis protein CcsA [Prevotellaceae bacterium]|jgi:ABC-type transport system involved in cytochrome c biogenesis permease subunit|nr:cytochrome c biogenesis protein CcsA [Prevotellaceae bacterium]